MNHIFCAIGAFVRLETLRVQNVIANWYQIQIDLFVDVIKQFILKGGYQPSLKESPKNTQIQSTPNNEKQNSHDGYSFVHRVFSKFSIYEKSETLVWCVNPKVVFDFNVNFGGVIKSETCIRGITVRSQ